MERDRTVMLVATNIQAAMERRGVNSAELARSAGLNSTGIYDILSGKSRSPRLDTIGKIARALGVPISSLFDDMEADDMREQIMSLIASLPDDDCRRILVTARAWVDASKATTR